MWIYESRTEPMAPKTNLCCYPGNASRSRRYLLRGSLPIIALTSCFVITAHPATAQLSASATQAGATPGPEAIKRHEQELETARAQQKSAAELREKLKGDIAAIGQDRSKLNRQLIDIAARVRGVETRIGEAEARLQTLDGGERQIQNSLQSRRVEIVEVLAALQRAGRRTPPALLVRPEDALQSLRTAMLLGSVVPALRVRAGKLVADLAELVKLREGIAAERDKLAVDRNASSMTTKPV